MVKDLSPQTQKLKCTWPWNIGKVITPKTNKILIAIYDLEKSMKITVTNKRSKTRSCWGGSLWIFWNKYPEELMSDHSKMKIQDACLALIRPIFVLNRNSVSFFCQKWFGDFHSCGLIDRFHYISCLQLILRIRDSYSVIMYLQAILPQNWITCSVAFNLPSLKLASLTDPTSLSDHPCLPDWPSLPVWPLPPWLTLPPSSLSDPCLPNWPYLHARPCLPDWPCLPLSDPCLPCCPCFIDWPYLPDWPCISGWPFIPDWPCVPDWPCLTVPSWLTLPPCLNLHLWLTLPPSPSTNDDVSLAPFLPG